MPRDEGDERWLLRSLDAIGERIPADEFPGDDAYDNDCAYLGETFALSELEKIFLVCVTAVGGEELVDGPLDVFAGCCT